MFRKRRRLNKRNSKPTIIASQSVSRKSGKRGAMVRGSRVVEIISKTLSEMLVCPLSEQPLRVCEKSNSLISHAIGVSFPTGSRVLYQGTGRSLKQIVTVQQRMQKRITRPRKNETNVL
uniref:Protein preY, mitochondrial n=1 Tax=Helianthus annuus TaxID=4232 RepID=A0A251TSG6_HELAN